MPLSPTYLYGLASTVYVTTCLVVAAVRWFHMCRPYNRNPEYYYPGRPFVTASWLSAITLLPYVLHPESADAWFLMRFFFLPVTLYHFTVMLFSYFGSVMQWKKWQLPTFIAGLPVILTLIAAIVMAVMPGDQIAGKPFESFILYVLGTLSTSICLVSVSVVYIWAKRMATSEDYSNPADFPIVQARNWLVIIVFNIVLCWTAVLICNQTVMALAQLLISVLCVLFLLTALHPNRNRPVEDPSDSVQDDETRVYLRSMSKKKQAEIITAIRTVVEQHQAYLEPHLTLQDVADRCGYNRTYISGIIKSELGGFFNYVNRLRLAHFDAYMRDNPGAPVSEAISAAGFGSRPTYYKIRHQLEEEE